MKERIHIVGPGKVGLALGLALQEAGALDGLVYCGRDPEPPQHPLFTGGIAHYRAGLTLPEPGTTALLLAVPDPAISEVAATLAAAGPQEAPCPALHHSGAFGADVLEPLHRAGWPVGTLHPFQSVGHPVKSAERLKGGWFAVGGEPQALAAARRLVRWLGGHELRIPANRRAVYHAAAATGSYHLQGLVLAAAELISRMGIPREDAVAAVLSLSKVALANLEELPLREAVTGPLVRGDPDTIRMHLSSLEPRARHLYRALALSLLELVPYGGAEDDLREIEALLTD